MPVCEICKKNVKTVFKCKECAAKFCSNCGDEARDLCEDCIAFEETQDQYKLEQEIEIDTD